MREARLHPTSSLVLARSLGNISSPSGWVGEVRVRLHKHIAMVMFRQASVGIERCDC